MDKIIGCAYTTPLMAKRKTTMKIEPAVQTLEFTIPVSTAARYLDLSAAASVVNRRFYRQGLNWAVAGFTVIAAPSTAGTITMSRLPNTWVVGNAWEKGFRAWQRQQDEALAEGDQQSVKGRYNDFKIFADDDHSGTASPHFLLPVDLSGATFSAPTEWLHSEVAIPNSPAPGVTTEYKLHMVGGDSATRDVKSLIKAYADSRATPQSPDPATPGTASTGLYTSMFDVGNNDSEVVANAEFRNDALPYNQNNYPGSAGNGGTLELMNRIFLNPGSTIPGKYSLAGSNIPCGLVKIDAGNVDNSFTLLVHMVPGTHRGYLATPMTEM